MKYYFKGKNTYPLFFFDTDYNILKTRQNRRNTLVFFNRQRHDESRLESTLENFQYAI